MHSFERVRGHVFFGADVWQYFGIISEGAHHKIFHFRKLRVLKTIKIDDKQTDRSFQTKGQPKNPRIIKDDKFAGQGVWAH